MKKDTIQKYSLRKYKGIGAASVLLGMMVVGASPVLAEETTNTANETTVTPAKDNVEMETLSNGTGSYTMPKMHVFDGLNYHATGTEDGYERNHRENEGRAKYNLDRVEKETIKKQGEDNFKDSKISYVTKEGEVLKEESDVEIPVGDKYLSSTTMDYKIRGLFGKRYEGNVANLTNDVLSKIKEADKVLEKNGEKYHKIDTEVDKHEGTTKETTFNDITVHANPGNLHNEDGSIRYNNIKEGSRVWLVSETSENQYGKYVLATKTSTSDDSWVVETFKKGEENAKAFTKENINSEGGIKEGDTILVVEKNEVALKLGAASTATEQAAYTAGVFFNEKSLYEGLNGLLGNQLEDLAKEQEQTIENKRLNKKEETWEELYKKQLINEHLVDKQNRPIYTAYETFHGYIRTNGDFKEYSDIEKYISILKEKFGEGPIKTNWDNTRDKIEPKFIGNIEEFKDTSNYEEEKANVEKFKESHKNIQYVNEVPSDANFVKNVFEVNVDYKLGNKDEDENYPSDENETEDSSKKYLAYTTGSREARYQSDNSNYQYGIGQLYKEFTKDGVTYRVASPTKYDQYAYVSGPSITEIHYYNLYQPTRAYHVSEELTKVKNIYSKEEKEVIENKGSVKVKYELLDGTSIKDDADVIKDAVIENIETKYYLDKEGNKVIVSKVNTPKNVDYDTTKLKLSEITSTSGKKYKLVGLKNTSSPENGKVTLGTTVITYVYKLSNGGNVYEKYMIEGTDTEIADTKQLTKEAIIGDEYISNAPEAGMMLSKDGKKYFYKGHRSTSASEKGVVGENEKTVIYDFVEYFSEKGKPEVQPELPKGIVSEKGEPEVHPELPEGIVSEKGEPEVLEKTEFLYRKGDSTINEIEKLSITQHIIEENGLEILPIERGVYPHKRGIINFGDKEYIYEFTSEDDGIITHYYKVKKRDEINIISEMPKVIENKNNNELFIKESEVVGKSVENIKGKTLPNTGSTSTETTTLGLLALIGIEVSRRKLKAK